MSNILQKKASVCAGSNCMTVYGETAEIINAIAVVTAFIVATAIIAKILK